MSRRIKQKIDLWAEREYIDFWSFVHLLTGVVFGFAPFLFNLPFIWIFVGVVVLLVLWEIFEIIKGINETKKNRLIDIIIGIAGFWITVYVYPFLDPELALGIGIVALFLDLFLNALGYVLYKLKLRA